MVLQWLRIWWYFLCRNFSKSMWKGLIQRCSHEHFPVLKKIVKARKWSWKWSNLNYIISSKLVERAVFKQTDRHMVQHLIYPVLQSSYCAGHSTETALLKVMNDIMHSMNSQCVALLVLLDLSVVFDTVNHEIPVNRMQKKVGLQGTVLNWFKSYLFNRSQWVSINGTLSGCFNLNCGFPLLLQHCCSKEFSVFMVSGCYHFAWDSC